MNEERKDTFHKHVSAKLLKRFNRSEVIRIVNRVDGLFPVESVDRIVADHEESFDDAIIMCGMTMERVRSEMLGRLPLIKRVIAGLATGRLMAELTIGLAVVIFLLGFNAANTEKLERMYVQEDTREQAD